MQIPDGNRTAEAPRVRMSPCWQAEISLQFGFKSNYDHMQQKAALFEADFPHGLEKKAGTASLAFLRGRPGSKSYPTTLQPLKELKVPFLYGSAGPAKSPSPQLQRLAAS
ncbi:hypothetical protein ATANTOWER_006265 [Ataeniobius toweri]|uniref:Uncharacterized protein n=1 Tax=Ataeniobius toweri TaxID=208326 RepID=A0ABU7ANH3_9TELE|nr:hypothetical protein [Ataeniobius toweri]